MKIKSYFWMCVWAVVFAAVLAFLLAGCGNNAHIEIKQTSANTFLVSDYHTGFFSGSNPNPPYSALEETCSTIGKNIATVTEAHDNSSVVVTCGEANRPTNPK